MALFSDYSAGGITFGTNDGLSLKLSLDSGLIRDLVDNPEAVMKKLSDGDFTPAFKRVQLLMIQMIKNHFRDKENEDGAWAELTDTTKDLKSRGIGRVSDGGRGASVADYLDPMLSTDQWYRSLTEGRSFRVGKRSTRLATRLPQNIHEFDHFISTNNSIFPGKHVPKRSVLWWDMDTIDEAIDLINDFTLVMFGAASK